MEREALESCTISQSFSEGETTSAAFNSLPKRVKWDAHTSAHHASIPRIGENRMCEVSNNSMHCLWEETGSAGRPERLIHITHIMGDFTHLRLPHISTRQDERAASTRDTAVVPGLHVLM